MTHDEIEKMPAGFLMRGLIAEKVFGFSNIKSGYQFIAGRTESGHLEPIPNYPEDIAAAWLVVGEMRKKGYAFYFEHRQDDSEYPLPFAMFSDKECNALSACVAETAPLAICRAVLMAVQK